jgi:polar amino acid transport system substrate-binding protein
LPTRPRWISFTAIIATPVLIFLFLFPTGWAHASGEPNTIQIVTPSWKNVTNEDGTGLYFDILRTVYRPFGIKVMYKIVPWKRAVKMLEYREADALPGGYFISNGETEALFPNYPIGNEVLCVLSKTGTVPRWDGQKSLVGKTIVWIRDYNYHKYLDVGVTWREIDSENQGWNLVDSGRVDFYMENLNFLNKHIRDSAVDKSGYNIQVVYTRALSLRFVNADRSKRLIDLYDSRMPVLLENGSIQRLFEKWGFPFTPFDPRPTETAGDP